MTLASKAAQAMTKEQLEQSIYARTRRFVDDDVLDAVLDLLAAAREVATMPEGWKLVPVEPTTEMVSAARISMSDYEADEYELRAAAALRSGIFVVPAAALAQPLEAQADARWQPIETAPKDGTWILMTNGVDVAGGQWIRDEGGTIEYRDEDGRYMGQTDRDDFEGWMDWMGGMPNPTHWQPLPAAPAALINEDKKS